MLCDGVSDEPEDGEVVFAAGVEVGGGVDGADGEGLGFLFAEAVATAGVRWRVGGGFTVRLGLRWVAEVGCGAAGAGVGGGHGGWVWIRVRICDSPPSMLASIDRQLVQHQELEQRMQ